MTATPDIPLTGPFHLNFRKFTQNWDDDTFYEFCQANKDLRIEYTKEGDLIIMPPTGGRTGNRNFGLIGQFHVWVKKDGTGRGFDSSTVFRLPNGAKRSPDLAWVRQECWAALTAEEQEKFPPLCPDFVVELRSRTDNLTDLQEKMVEYRDNGAQLGWLIDPQERKVHVYRPGHEVAVLDDPDEISGAPELPGFALQLAEIWNA